MGKLLAVVLLFSLSAAALGCDDDDPIEEDVPILEPEPSGSPSEIANGLDERGRSTLGCAGTPPRALGDARTLELTGYVRTFVDPSNEACGQPAARVEAFDDSGSIGSTFSDVANGRLSLNIPVREPGFIGTTAVTAEGYMEQRFTASRPVTSTAFSGWTWLATEEDVRTLADEAGVTLEPDKGIVVGAVHDCESGLLGLFGVENAVIRWGGSTDGVIYFAGPHIGRPTSTACDPENPNPREPVGLEGFGVDRSATFTGESGRFAIANVRPGPLTVEAFARDERGGPLMLLSRAEIEVRAGVINVVGLEPRVGADR